MLDSVGSALAQAPVTPACETSRRNSSSSAASRCANRLSSRHNFLCHKHHTNMVSLRKHWWIYCAQVSKRKKYWSYGRKS